MTTTIEAWHARIEESPDDIDLRLVFADWLLERGDPLGEFIHFECRLLQEPGHPEASRWRELASELRKKHTKSWWGRGSDVVVRGGMIEEAVGGKVAILDRLQRVAPALRRLKVAAFGGTKDENLRAIGAHPLWRRICRVDLNGNEMVRAILAALEADNLPRLERLRAAHLDASRTKELFALLERRAPRLTQLEIPQLHGSSVIAMLGAWKRSLVMLDLYGNPLDHKTVRALASGRLLMGIRELMLGETGIGPEGLAALAACPHLATLERLELRRTGLTSKAVNVATALAALASATPRLISLELMGARLGVKEIAALTERDPLTNLRELSLQGCAIGDAGLTQLLASACAGRLSALNLRGNHLSDESARLLARSPRLAGLRLLNLENNPLTKKGIEALRGGPSLAKVIITHGDGAGGMPGPHNEKDGVWLGSTVYSEKSVLRRPEPAA
jgi:uncharacterized protein (TIGR02996 family)